ncbi:MAG: GLUG motif-containing protein, partial [Intestinibacter sp.]
DRTQAGKLIIKADYFSQGIISDNGDYILTLTNSNYTPSPQTVTINISDEKEDSSDVPSLVDGYYEIATEGQLSWLKKQINIKGNQTINAKLIADIDLGGKPWSPIVPSGATWTGAFDGNGHAITGLYVNGEVGDSNANYYGLFGRINGATIKDLTVKGRVTGNLYVGGIAGNAGSTSVIENCVSDVEVNGKQGDGGIVGTTSGSAQVSKCVNYGEVNATLTQAGGIVGSSNGELVDQCVNKGDITAEENNVGGIVGYDYKTVTNCYNTGTITGKIQSSTKGIGGIVGYHSNTKEISNCYNIGNVVCTQADETNIGQIAGYVDSSSTIGGYYKQDLNIKGVGKATSSTTDNTAAKTEEEMKSDEFVQALGELFAKDSANLNSGYPILSWQQANQTVVIKFENGDDVVAKEVQKGQVLDYTPEAPVKSGYTFVGWYENTDDVTTSYENNKFATTNTTYKAKWAHVTMLGAQVKAVVDEKSGIRFGTKIYNDGDEIVEKGTIILPASLLPEGESLTLDTPQIVKSIGKVNYEVNEKENYVTYLGTIINIKREKFDTAMTASSYVIYKDKAGNQYTVYSPYKNGSTTINKLLGVNK